MSSLPNVKCEEINRKNLKDEHNLRPSSLLENFKILKRRRSKLKCLIFEMLLIQTEEKPKLNTQAGSIRSHHASLHYVFLFHTSISVEIFMLISSHFRFDDDDMKSPKRHVTALLSLIFLLKCISKSTTIVQLRTIMPCMLLYSPKKQDPTSWRHLFGK